MYVFLRSIYGVKAALLHITIIVIVISTISPSIHIYIFMYTKVYSRSYKYIHTVHNTHTYNTQIHTQIKFSQDTSMRMEITFMGSVQWICVQCKCICIPLCLQKNEPPFHLAHKLNSFTKIFHIVGWILCKHKHQKPYHMYYVYYILFYMHRYVLTPFENCVVYFLANIRRSFSFTALEGYTGIVFR